MPGGPLVVAGEQHRGHAGGPDIPDGPGGVWPQGVCQGQKARRAAVYRHIDDGAALLQGRDGSLGQGFPGDMFLCQQLPVTGDEVMTRHSGRNTPAGEHLEVRCLRRRRDGLGSPALNNGTAQRVLGPELRPRSPGVERVPGYVRQQALHQLHLGGAEGQSACFVKGHLGDGGQPFQSVSLPHQKAVPGGVADGGHDGSGSGQHQGTGAEYHQNGHRSDGIPGDEARQGGGGQGRHYDPGGPAVCQPHDPGLAGIGGLDQPDHPLDRTVLPHLRRPHLEGAELVHRAAGNLVSGPLVHRQGLAGHHRLVDGGLSGENLSVHWHGLARQHPEHVAHSHLLGGNGLLPAAGEAAGGLGRQMHQLLDAGPRPGHREILQQGAQLHDEGHLAGGEVLPNDEGGNQGDGHQHVRLDVKGCHQADDCLQDDGDTAEDDSCPGGVKGQLRQQVEDADKQGDAGEDQAGHGLLHAAPLQKSLQSMDQMAHILSLYLWGYMYIIPIGVCLSRKSAAGFRQNTLRHTDSSCKMTTKQEGENRNATAALPDRRPAHSGPPVR